MSWYTTAYKIISEQTQEMKECGITDIKRQMQLVSKNYPFYERKYWPYKAWLRAKKDFFLGPRKQEQRGRPGRFDSSRLSRAEKKAQLKLF